MLAAACPRPLAALFLAGSLTDIWQAGPRGGGRDPDRGPGPGRGPRRAHIMSQSLLRRRPGGQANSVNYDRVTCTYAPSTMFISKMQIASRSRLYAPLHWRLQTISRLDFLHCSLNAQLGFDGCGGPTIQRGEGRMG